MPDLGQLADVDVPRVITPSYGATIVAYVRSAWTRRASDSATLDAGDGGGRVGAGLVDQSPGHCTTPASAVPTCASISSRAASDASSLLRVSSSRLPVRARSLMELLDARELGLPAREVGLDPLDAGLDLDQLRLDAGEAGLGDLLGGPGLGELGLGLLDQRPASARPRRRARARSSTARTWPFFTFAPMSTFHFRT